MKYLLFDIGASRTRITISNDGDTVGEPVIFETPKKYEDGIKIIYEKSKQLGGDFGAAAGGIAGPINREKTMINNAPNLPDWCDKPLKNSLEEALGTKVNLENDTALVGLGEAVAGAGNNNSIVAYVTVSTGINGVKIVDKKIVKNFLGYEIGKQIVDFDESTIKGNWENAISGSSLEKKYSKNPDEINDEKIWEDEVKLLAYGLHNVILFWSPEVLILGGGLMKKIAIEKVEEKLKEILTVFPILPEIKKSELGDVGGLYGALSYVKEI